MMTRYLNKDFLNYKFKSKLATFLKTYEDIYIHNWVQFLNVSN